MSGNTEIAQQAVSLEQQKAIIEAKDVLLNKSRVMRQLGQAQAFSFIKKLATVAELSAIQSIKEAKEYKGLVYLDADGNRQQVANWDEYCDVFVGEPRRTVDERLLNLNAFGEEFFEASQKIGLGYRELRKLRQLPAEQQRLVMENEAINAGDKEAVHELIDELNAQHQKELKAAKGEKAEVEQQLKVARQMRDEAQVQANQFREELASRKFNPDAWKKDVSGLVLTIATIEGTILQELAKLALVREKIANCDSDETLAKDPATYQAAMTYLAGSMLASSRAIAEDAAAFWQDTDLQFGGFADKARPAVSILEELAAAAAGA